MWIKLTDVRPPQDTAICKQCWGAPQLYMRHVKQLILLAYYLLRSRPLKYCALYITRFMFSRVPIQRGPIKHAIENNTLIIDEKKSKFVLTKGTSYLLFMGMLWSSYPENFVGNWSRYTGTAWYIFCVLLYVSMLTSVSSISLTRLSRYMYSNEGYY